MWMYYFHVLVNMLRQRTIEEYLALKRELGVKQGEAADYGKLCLVSHFLGEYFKAKDCLEKALAIERDIDDRRREALFLGNLGTVFQCSVCSLSC